MIPITPLGNAVNSIVCFLGSVRLCSSYLENKEKKLGYFSIAFIFLTIAFFLLATPEIIFKNPKVIGLAIEIAQFFIFLAISFFISIPLELLGWRKMRIFSFWVLIIIGLVIEVFTVGRILFTKREPVLLYLNPPFIYWESNRGMVVGLVQGVVLGVSILSSAAFFLVNGFKSQERRVKTRSFFFAGGLIVLAVASAMNYILGEPTSSGDIILPTVFSTVTSVLGFLLLLLGIYYQGRK